MIKTIFSVIIGNTLYFLAVGYLKDRVRELDRREAEFFDQDDWL